jgi:hypothetical protein
MLFHKAFVECKDPADFWRSLNYFTGRKKREDVPALRMMDGVMATTEEEKSEALRRQFASVFNDKSPVGLPCTPVTCQLPETTPKMCVLRTLQLIHRLPTRKASGSDDIPAFVVKKCSLVIAPCLTLLADRILEDREYPELWKTALVTPVAKVRVPVEPADFRPVSLLSIMSKIIERLLNDLFMRYIQPHLADNQFGFRQRRSTSDAVLLLQHLVLRGYEKCENLNRPGKVVVVYFDVSKAFDTVPHLSLLEYCRRKYGLPEYLLQLIKSYLSGRSMRVRVGSSVSNASPVTSGVPQGSVLGPAFFLAYVNAITELSLSADSHLILYADDMVLIHALNSVDAVKEIQADVNKISACIMELGLRLNTGKCEYQIISLNSGGEKTDLQISLEGAKLRLVESYRYLGVDIDSRLTFASHTSRVISNAKMAIGVLCRTLRKWALKEVFSKAVTAIVLPAFFYAIEVWCPPNAKEKEKLERVVKYAARLALNNFSREASYVDLLAALSWKPLYRMIAEKRLLTIKKYMEGYRFIPDNVFQLERENLNRHSRRLNEKKHRHCCTLELTQSKNKLEVSLGAAQMRLLWNALDEATVMMSINQFSMAIKSENIFQMLCTKGTIHCLAV